MNSSLAIPEALRQQFEALERRLWRFDLLLAVCGAAGSLLVSFAGIFLSDRFWDTPPVLRTIISGGGALAVAGFFYGYGRRWIWGNRSFPLLATLVQRRYRRLGDRLLGIVELADETARPANFSAALCKAAITQVANEAAKFDFQQAVTTKRPRQFLLGALIAGIVAAGFCLVAPNAGWNALVRWILPMADVARYTFVSLNNLPDRLVVAHGESFGLSVGLSANSLLRPTRVSAQFDGQTPITAPVHDRTASFQFPGQTRPTLLRLRAGDVQRQIRIEPAFRPELKELIAHQELPAYLLYPTVDSSINGSTLTFLKGSRIVLTGRITRALQSASLDSAPLRITADTFSTEPATWDSPAALTFTWKDQLGLEATAPTRIRLEPIDDVAPKVECPGLPFAIAILEEEVVHINIAATDDFGIQDVGVRWQTRSNRKRQPRTQSPPPEPPERPAPPAPPEPEEYQTGHGTAQTKTLTSRFDFSPALLHIPADTAVTFYATVTDRLPGRPASLSTMHQIYVLSRASHAQLVQEELEKLAARLEELTRRQEALLAEGKTLREQPPGKLAEAGKKLSAQAAEQQETAEQLEKLARETTKTLSEALRNQEISPSTIKDLAEHAETMHELAQQNMVAAALSLNAARNDPHNRAPKLDQALTQESEILQKLRELQKMHESSLEQMRAQNLALRLRKIASTEKEIVKELKVIVPETIGMTPEELSAEARQTVERLVALHETGRGESTKLQAEIARFFERTKLQRYGEVSQEMEKNSTGDALEKLARLLGKNVAVQAMEKADEWSQRFEQWAERLSEKDDSKAANSGQEEGSEAAMKALMELARIRQREAALRERTNALEHQKSFNPRYESEAKAAMEAQQQVQRELEALQANADSPVPPQALDPVGQAMKEAGELLGKPETGEPTTNAETDAVNMLDAILTSQGKGKGMSALLRMMGIGAGNSPGGSMAGGDTNRTNEPIAGSRTGAALESRRVIQASGVAGAPLPAEFRDAIENYQRAIEREAPLP